MSVREFTRSVKAGEFGENDKKWFPAWLRRYAEFVNAGDSANLAHLALRGFLMSGS